MRITVITPTLNNEKTLPSFLQSISKQNYNKKNIEILIVDGGSKDKTREIATKYGAKIVDNPHVLAEPAISLGMQRATGDIWMILATDNIYKDTEAFQTIANIFQDETIYATFPKHESDASDTLFTKYHNTFTDPFNHFVYGDAANARTFKKVYKTITHTAVYDVYDYSSSPTRPLIAFAQGFAIRGSYKRGHEEAFDDVRPVIDLIENHKKIAYIHSLSLYHHTISGLSHFIRKQRWATLNAISKKNYGIKYRARKLSSDQQLRMTLWPLYAFSIVGPVLRALWGLIVDREPLWILHPFMCFASAYASALQVILYNVNKLQTISRQ